MVFDNAEDPKAMAEFLLDGPGRIVITSRKPDDVPVFCMLDGRPLNSSYVRLLFQRLGRAAGIAKRVHPHGLRHTHVRSFDPKGSTSGSSPNNWATHPLRPRRGILTT